jgi:hypothetical protein
MLRFKVVETDRHYWVVTCKNAEFHREKNPFAGHRSTNWFGVLIRKNR